jgi:hypothetical protein
MITLHWFTLLSGAIFFMSFGAFVVFMGGSKGDPGGPR